MSCFLDVNGAATLASVLHRETPVSAVFNAAQSFAPSPHIPTRYLWTRNKYYTSHISHFCVVNSVTHATFIVPNVHSNLNIQI